MSFELDSILFHCILLRSDEHLLGQGGGRGQADDLHGQHHQQGQLGVTAVSGDIRHDPSPGQLQGILLPRGLLPAPGPQRLRVRAGVGAEGGYHGDPAAHRGPAPRLVH